MEKYERQQAVFAGRKSFSKTDADATFMRMKGDAMGNGQLKAAYNVQAGTENQFIVGTTVHQRPGDTACAIPHCEHVKERIGHLPASFAADAGYGSEENYAYLEREGADAYVTGQAPLSPLEASRNHPSPGPSRRGPGSPWCDNASRGYASRTRRRTPGVQVAGQ